MTLQFEFKDSGINHKKLSSKNTSLFFYFEKVTSNFNTFLIFYYSHLYKINGPAKAVFIICSVRNKKGCYKKELASDVSYISSKPQSVIRIVMNDIPQIHQCYQKISASLS